MLSILKNPIRLIVVWCAGASLFWIGALLIESMVVHGGALNGVADALYLVRIGAKTTMICSAVVGGLHVIMQCMSRTRLSRFAFVGAVLFLIGGLSPYLWTVVVNSTNGDWISSQSWTGWFRGAMCGMLAVPLVVGWGWHCKVMGVVLGERTFLYPAGGRVLQMRGYWGAGVIGGVVWCAGYLVICFGMQNQVHLAIPLSVLLWFVGSTIVSRLLWCAAGQNGSAIVLLLIFLGGIGGVVWGRWSTVSVFHSGTGSLSSLSAMWVDTPDIEVGRFDVSQVSHIECDGVDTSGINRVATAWPAPAEKRRNVIFISSEALRRDMLDKVIDGKALMPSLAAFKEKATYFNHAIATYPATLFALGGVVTGRYPSEILFSSSVPDNVFTMTAHRFASQWIILPKNTWFEMPVIKSLFVQSATLKMDKTSRQMTRRLIGHLKEQRRDGRSTFAWIHYYDPHAPYRRHPDFDFGKGKKNAYYSELAYVDGEMERLFSYLAADGWYEDSLVVVFGDHGQGLGEKGYWGHHVHLTRWITDVPVLMRGPGIDAEVVETPVALMDLASSVLHFLDMDIRDGMSGISLMERKSGRSPDPYLVAEAFPLRGRELFSFSQNPIKNLTELQDKIEQIMETARNYSPKVALIDGDWRLIVDRATGARRLYNSRIDPENSENIYHAHSLRVAEYELFLQQWHHHRSRRFYCDVVEN